MLNAAAVLDRNVRMPSYVPEAQLTPMLQSVDAVSAGVAKVRHLAMLFTPLVSVIV